MPPLEAGYRPRPERDRPKRGGRKSAADEEAKQRLPLQRLRGQSDAQAVPVIERMRRKRTSTRT